MLYRMKDLIKIVGLSRRTIERLIEEGEFPLPYKAGRSNVWKKEDIREWVDHLDQAGSSGSRSVAGVNESV